ncbi:Nif3-like dinuclear metal center hexameric protein [Mycoplasma sp. 5912]
MSVNTIIEYLESLFPLSNKEIWDPSGYALKANKNKKVTSVVLAIDLTSDVYNFALENQCNLIITHHPFLFEKTKTDMLQKAEYKQKIKKGLVKNKISAYSMHTNYDFDVNGTSYQIAKAINLSNYVISEGPRYTAIIAKKISISDVQKLFWEYLNLSNFQSNASDLEYKYSYCVILAGAGDIITINQLAKKYPNSLFITSDVKWNDWIAYKEHKIAVLAIPHLVEQVFANHIQEILQAKFHNLKIHIYKLKIPYQNIKGSNET